MQRSRYVIAVHGGAGVWRNELTPGRERTAAAVIGDALQAGEKILSQRGSSIEAVEQAIRLLESSPLFNAGRGAVLASDGSAELDAAIMDGASRRAGAVAAVKRLRNPISAARLVMERSPHVLLVGKGAEAFAHGCGGELVSPAHFVTPERKRQLALVQAEARANAARRADPSDHDMIGTVGAVALDLDGNLAAGTSTGGMVNKRYGRVGDSPLIGAGTYADNRTCAVSCTGHGEFFIRAVAAYQVSALMLLNKSSIDEAADAVLSDVAQIGGRGGLIAVDNAGHVAMPFNTDGMFRGVITAGTKEFVAVYPGRK